MDKSDNVKRKKGIRRAMVKYIAKRNRDRQSKEGRTGKEYIHRRNREASREYSSRLWTHCEFCISFISKRVGELFSLLNRPEPNAFIR